MMTATATEVQNNFGKYLQMAQAGGEVLVVKNGKEVARLVSYEKSVSFLTDSLTGVLKYVATKYVKTFGKHRMK